MQESKSSLGPPWSNWTECPSSSLWTHTGEGSQYSWETSGGSGKFFTLHTTRDVTLTLYWKHKPALEAIGAPYSTVTASWHSFSILISFPRVTLSGV